MLELEIVVRCSRKPIAIPSDKKMVFLRTLRKYRSILLLSARKGCTKAQTMKKWQVRKIGGFSVFRATEESLPLHKCFIKKPRVMDSI